MSETDKWFLRAKVKENDLLSVFLAREIRVSFPEVKVMLIRNSKLKQSKPSTIFFSVSIKRHERYFLKIRNLRGHIWRSLGFRRRSTEEWWLVGDKGSGE